MTEAFFIVLILEKVSVRTVFILEKMSFSVIFIIEKVYLCNASI